MTKLKTALRKTARKVGPRRGPAAGFVTLVTIGLVAPAAQAGEWYRYQDENGVVVMSHHVPAEFAHKGYTVVNDDGRVLRVVARQLSPEEIVVRDAQLARDAALEAQRQAAVERDRQLMQLYATPDEVTFAMNTQMDQIDDYIAKLKAELQQKRHQLSRYQTQAAEKERGQLPVSRDILENIDAAEAEIQRITAEVDSKEREKTEVESEFTRKRERIYELYGLERPPIAAN